MRILKRTLKIAAVILLALFLLLALALELPFLWAGDSADATGYADWMSRTFTGPERLVDIAMLGAHDALTADMELSSRVDEASVASPFQLGICKSLGYRQSKTQLAGVSGLLEGGVRYLDIRITRDPDTGTFYTVHNYYSAPLAQYLDEITDFLARHPGEILVLDFQHCYDVSAPDGRLGETHFEELYALLLKSGLLDYACTPALDTAVYAGVTENGSRAACVILMKYTGGHTEFLDYETSIESDWFNTDSPETVFAGLDAAAARQDGMDAGRFRVQQGVLTMQANLPGIFNALGSWSLLRRAEAFNADYAQRQNEAWLRAMPIVMTDHTLSGKGGAHALLMEKIIAYNKTLASAAQE